MPNVVTIQQESVSAALKKILFDYVGNRAFPGTAQAGEPHHAAAMLVALGTLLHGDGLLMPNNAWILAHANKSLDIGSWRMLPASDLPASEPTLAASATFGWPRLAGHAYGVGPDARKSLLLNTRVKPTLLVVELVPARLIAEICRVPAVPPVVPGLAARKLASLGEPELTA